MNKTTIASEQTEEKTYDIPVVWSMWGKHSVTATSLEEAKLKAVEMGLPDAFGSHYLDDSLEVDDEGCNMISDEVD